MRGGLANRTSNTPTFNFSGSSQWRSPENAAIMAGERGAETAWYLSGQHTGRTELALTAHGEQGARKLGPALEQIAFSMVLTSPRLRARQTCELAGFDGRAQVDPELAEWDYGAYEGKRSADIRLERPDWDIWRDGCPDGETVANVSARADRVVARLRPVVDAVVLFSHGQFGRVLAARWLGLDASAGSDSRSIPHRSARSDSRRTIPLARTSHCGTPPRPHWAASDRQGRFRADPPPCASAI